MVSVFEDEKDMSILKADGKRPDEREWFKGAINREGVLDRGHRILDTG